MAKSGEESKPAGGGTPEVLPRPDFRFPGEVGRHSRVVIGSFQAAESSR